MKRFNMSSMTVVNTAVIATLGLTMLTGCGKKKNKVNPAVPIETTFGMPGGVYPGQVGYGNYSPQVQQFKSQIPCSYGGQRLANDYTFTAMGGSGNNITGPFQQGAMGGQVTAIYAGRSTYGDLIVVSKVTNGGSQILGWNISVSMCSQYPLIQDQRPLSGFQAPQGITIAENAGCGYGKVLSAQNTVMIAPSFQYFPQAAVYTTFYPISNNCY